MGLSVPHSIAMMDTRELGLKVIVGNCFLLEKICPKPGKQICGTSAYMHKNEWRREGEKSGSTYPINFIYEMELDNQRAI